MESGLDFYPDGTEHPSVNGQVRYVDGEGFKFFEEGQELSLAGEGVTEAQHRALRQLIHFLDQGPEGNSFKEVLPVASPFPTQVVWWDSGDKNVKILEKTVIRNAGQFPTEIKWEIYNLAGDTILATVTDFITYSGPFEVSRDRLFSL